MSALSFLAPAALLGLLALPALWWLLRATPPQPSSTPFPPLQLLAQLTDDDVTPVRTPWWLLALRLLLLALIVLAFAGPIWRASEALTLPGESEQPLLIVMESDWASAATWDARRAQAERLIDAASLQNRPVGLVAYPQPNQALPLPGDRSEALAVLETLDPHPVEQDFTALREDLTALLQNSAWSNSALVVLTSGLANEVDNTLWATLTENRPVSFVAGDPPGLVTLLDGGRDGPAMRLISIDNMTSTATTATAYDSAGRSLATVPIRDDQGTVKERIAFDLPLDVRNDIARIALLPTRHAGQVVLVDDRAERRRVGVVSGEGRDEAQPLLSGTTFVERALEPTADVVTPRSGEVAREIEDLIESGANVIVLVNVASLVPSTVERLDNWMERGGVLIRFASAGLTQSTDALTPVPLRAVDRQLGGTLTWDEPKAIAPFSLQSPFSGLSIPQDIRIERQVLSEPGALLAERTYAELTDATPLVTGEDRGQGYLILFHITPETSWSNLPLSGLFVDMLGRLVNLSAVHLTGSAQTFAPQAQASAQASAERGQEVQTGTSTLSPRSTLNAFGVLGAPPGHAEGLQLSSGITAVTLENPPGFYGAMDTVQATNMFAEPPVLNLVRAEDLQASGLRTLTIGPDEARALRPGLITLAVVLALADAIIVLVMSGALSNIKPARFRRSAKIVASSLTLLFAGGLSMMLIGEALAQSASPSGESERLIAAASTTRFAYVRTGDSELDQRTAQGMAGLSLILNQRTAFEPAEPFAIDPLVDELAFYPLIYWPMPSLAMTVSDALVARVDAYMNNGGTILFDTRDEANIFGTQSVSPQTQNLRALLNALDIPPLEPVPDDHVLTKAFYLIDSFPGRYASGPLWVEALPQGQTIADRPARGGDGVSPIMITGNDFASAWALSADGRPLYSTVPADPLQREFAFRSGINIAMYIMTGNYKADQVHIPALLERLVQ
ncbi:MAG: DUF4159 domain-containing protein [Pseudomonadota bacterium]